MVVDHLKDIRQMQAYAGWVREESNHICANLSSLCVIYNQRRHRRLRIKNLIDWLTLNVVLPLWYYFNTHNNTTQRTRHHHLPCTRTKQSYYVGKKKIHITHMMWNAIGEEVFGGSKKQKIRTSKNPATSFNFYSTQSQMTVRLSIKSISLSLARSLGEFLRGHHRSREIPMRIVSDWAREKSLRFRSVSVFFSFSSSRLCLMFFFSLCAGSWQHCDMDEKFLWFSRELPYISKFRKWWRREETFQLTFADTCPWLGLFSSGHNNFFCVFFFFCWFNCTRRESHELSDHQFLLYFTTFHYYLFQYHNTKNPRSHVRHTTTMRSFSLDNQTANVKYFSSPERKTRVWRKSQEKRK